MASSEHQIKEVSDTASKSGIFEMNMENNSLRQFSASGRNTASNPFTRRDMKEALNQQQEKEEVADQSADVEIDQILNMKNEEEKPNDEIDTKDLD